MLDYIFFVLVVAALGAIAGAVAAFTHQALINKAITEVKAEVAKLEALKAKL